MATKSIYKSRMPFKGVFGFFCGEHMAITIPETEPLEFYSGATAKALIIKKQNRVLSEARISKSRGEFYG